MQLFAGRISKAVPRDLYSEMSCTFCVFPLGMQTRGGCGLIRKLEKRVERLRRPFDRSCWTKQEKVACSPFFDATLLQVEATCVASHHSIHLFRLFPKSTLVFFPSFVGQVCVCRSCDIPEFLSSSSPMSDCLHVFSPVSNCFSSLCLQIQRALRWITARKTTREPWRQL